MRKEVLALLDVKQDRPVADPGLLGGLGECAERAMGGVEVAGLELRHSGQKARSLGLLVGANAWGIAGQKLMHDD